MCVEGCYRFRQDVENWEPSLQRNEMGCVFAFSQQQHNHWIMHIPSVRNFRGAGSHRLTPGDIVVLLQGKATADMVILQGNCLVDESIMSGEVCLPQLLSLFVDFSCCLKLITGMCYCLQSYGNHMVA